MCTQKNLHEYTSATREEEEEREREREGLITEEAGAERATAANFAIFFYLKEPSL